MDVRHIADPYMDDFIIGTEFQGSEEETIRLHDQHVRQVLDCLLKHKMVADLAKSTFCCKVVEFCGHVSSHGCRRPTPGKLRAMEKWPKPTTVTHLRAFLGFVNWYAEYIEGFAAVAAALQDVLHLKKADAKSGCKKKIELVERSGHRL